MTLIRKAMPSPNYSNRAGTGVRLIVLHTAEGALTIESLGNYFGSTASQVSSHTGADDKVNTVGEYVRPGYKAWTQSGANSVAVAIEMCAFTRWSTAEWHNHPNMLKNVAAWIAEESVRFGIPIARLTPEQAQGAARGVCQHRDLGAWGGGHVDCGPGFPMTEVLNMARGIKPGPKPPASAAKPPASSGVKAPPFPGTYLTYPPVTYGHGTRDWQAQMKYRGWAITVDDAYGQQSKDVCKKFQGEKHLAVDGVVGPATWAAAWTSPVT